MSDGPGGAHVDAGTLVRLLDGAATAEERRAAEGHVASCARCRSEMDALGRWDGAVRALLADDQGVPAPPPLLPAGTTATRAVRRRPRVRPSWRRGAELAAILAAAVLVAVVLVPPVRAIAQAIVARVRSVVSGDVPAAPHAAPSRPRRPTERVLVELVPEPGELLLEFQAAAADATLDVLPHAAPTVVLVAAVERAPAVLVRPGSIVVQTGGSVGTRFRVLLPTRVRQLSVRVAGGAPRTVLRDSLVAGEPRRIPLAGSPP